jgi:hypothetical protein
MFLTSKVGRGSKFLLVLLSACGPTTLAEIRTSCDADARYYRDKGYSPDALSRFYDRCVEYGVKDVHNRALMWEAVGRTAEAVSDGLNPPLITCTTSCSFGTCRTVCR